MPYTVYMRINKAYLNNLVTISVLSFIILIFRLLIPEFPLEWYGYDFGFYSFAIQHTPLNSFSYLLGISHDYGNHLFVIINWLRLPQLPMLWILYYAFHVGSGIILWLILKRKSQLAGFVGVILFSASIAQYQLHTMFLWKAAYGQLLLLAAFYLLENNRWRLAVIPSVLLFITHKTTSVVYFILLTLYALITFRSQKKILISIAISLIILIAAFLQTYGLLRLYKDFFAPINSAVAQGIFISTYTYLQYAWMLIAFAGGGLLLAYTNKRTDQQTTLWTILLFITLFWVVAKLPFSNRIIQYLDLALIFFAASSVTGFNEKWQKMIAAIILCLTVIVQLYFFQKPISPLISGTEVMEIQKFTKSNQGAFVLATDAQDGPWLLAYLGGNIRLAGPGLFEDVLTYGEWNMLWNEDTDSQKLLSKFPQPLYIYERAGAFTPALESCLESVSDNFYRYTCN